MQLSDSDLKRLEVEINTSIDKHSLETLTEGPRKHLGMSEIGNDCSRQLWYKFRWMYSEVHSGRTLRLFKRGHREENRYIEILKGIGCEVFQHENPVLHYHPESDSYHLGATFNPGDGLVHDVSGMLEHETEAAKRGLMRKQFRASGVMGHYGGSCDGVALTPWIKGVPFLLEFKTHNQKSFDKYLEIGVHKSKPQHYSQMCSYGFKMKIDYAIYFPENKNTDEIRVSVIKLDHNEGMLLEIKAEKIIGSQTAPERISDNPAYYKCKYCPALDLCHKNAKPLKNCRSCVMATPIDDGKWKCERFGIIPDSFIETACDRWTPL